MKILVPTKRVPDTDQKIVASDDGGHVNLHDVPFIINPFDAIALEEALRISEQQSNAVEVVAVGIGSEAYEQQLRTALAMGAARAIHVQCHQMLDSWNVAYLLKAVIEREQPQLVIMGKQAVDDDANQTGQLLAALLDWPQATFASRLAINGTEISVERETDYGIETVVLPLPAVVTADLRLNEPRYASLTGIMKARRTPLENLTCEQLGVAIEPRAVIVRYRSTVARGRGERVSTVDELMEGLSRTGIRLHNRDQNSRPAIKL